MDFYEFVDAQQRRAKKHLKIIKEILEQADLQVVDKLEERKDPYIFVFSPHKNLSFEGVRIYEVGGELAYRIQKEPDTHPYGKAYVLPVEEMFNDLLGEEGMNDKKIAKEISESIVKELKDFFKKSYEAENSGPPREDPLDQVNMRSTGTDYSNKVMNIDNR